MTTQNPQIAMSADSHETLQAAIGVAHAAQIAQRKAQTRLGEVWGTPEQPEARAAYDAADAAYTAAAKVEAAAKAAYEAAMRPIHAANRVRERRHDGR